MTNICAVAALGMQLMFSKRPNFYWRMRHPLSNVRTQNFAASITACVKVLLQNDDDQFAEPRIQPTGGCSIKRRSGTSCGNATTSNTDRRKPCSCEAARVIQGCNGSRICSN